MFLLNSQIPPATISSIEPILLPKLRIYFAEFPYEHYNSVAEYYSQRPVSVWVRFCMLNACIFTRSAFNIISSSQDDPPTTC